MTVLEVIRRGAEFLAGKKVDSPRLQMELLLAHVLQLPRLKLYLNFERALTDAEAETVRQLVKRRGQREPLQHLLGTVCFCGLELAVNRAVLIPRPETELLAEQAWKFCQGLAVSNPAPVVLDYGTGSGCLAICVAFHCPSATIHALDISPDALAVAAQNAQRHQVQDRIHFCAGDSLDALPSGLHFDLMVSNPPYIPKAEIPGLMPEVRDWDPHLALDGGSDGLDFFRRLAAEAPPWVRSGSRIMLEFGDQQGTAVREIFASSAWHIDAVLPDYSARERILIAHWGD